MMQLANVLSRAADRPVVDRTGLSGEFDVELRWTSALEVTSPTGNAESLFTALGQQLGSNLSPPEVRWKCSSSTASSDRRRTDALGCERVEV